MKNIGKITVPDGSYWVVKKAGYSLSKGRFILSIDTFPLVNANENHHFFNYDMSVDADGCLNTAMHDASGNIKIDYDPNREGMDSSMGFSVNGNYEIEAAKGIIHPQEARFFLSLKVESQEFYNDIGQHGFEINCLIERVGNWKLWFNS